MSSLANRFAELNAEKPEISQADLARATGAKRPSVNGWFSGKTKTMKIETAMPSCVPVLFHWGWIRYLALNDHVAQL